jgi:hypothetical protein
MRSCVPCFLFASTCVFSYAQPLDLSRYDAHVAYSVDVIKNDEWAAENFYAVKAKGKWGAITEKGVSVIPLKYDTLILFSGNFSIGAKKGKFGLLDLKGAELTAFKYDSLYSDFSRQIIAVINRKLGLLSDEGKEITPLVYSAITRQSVYGCRCVEKNGRIAVLAGSGKELTPFEYDLLQLYEPPLDVWVLRKNGKWGFYDCEQQKTITPFVYDKVEKFYGYEADVIEKGVKKKIKLK